MKVNQSNEALLIINRAALNELHELALKNTLPIKDLSYREAQQLLTLDALNRYFEQYGLQAPFKLEF